MLCRNMLKLIENVILKVKMYISLLVRAAPNVLININNKKIKLLQQVAEMSGYFEYQHWKLDILYGIKEKVPTQYRVHGKYYSTRIE